MSSSRMADGKARATVAAISRYKTTQLVRARQRGVSGSKTERTSQSNDALIQILLRLRRRIVASDLAHRMRVYCRCLIDRRNDVM